MDCHLATMERLGIRYDLLAHESDILRLHFWDRAFALLKESGAIRLETDGKNGRLLGAVDGRRRTTPPRTASTRTRSSSARNGTVTYTGKDIAYQLWKLGLLDRDFRYRRHRTLRRRPRALDHDQRRGRAGRAARSATPARSTTSSTSASPTRSGW